MFPPTGTLGMGQKLPSCKPQVNPNQRCGQLSQIPIFHSKVQFFQELQLHCRDNCPSKHSCAFWGPRCAPVTCTCTGEVGNSWVFPLSIGFNPNKLPSTSVVALSRDLLPCSASWAVLWSSSSHKPNDSPHFYKHIHVCCQTHELLFCRLLQESNQ